MELRLPAQRNVKQEKFFCCEKYLQGVGLAICKQSRPVLSPTRFLHFYTPRSAVRPRQLLRHVKCAGQYTYTAPQRKSGDTCSVRGLA